DGPVWKTLIRLWRIIFIKAGIKAISENGGISRFKQLGIAVFRFATEELPKIKASSDTPETWMQLKQAHPVLSQLSRCTPENLSVLREKNKGGGWRLRGSPGWSGLKFGAAKRGWEFPFIIKELKRAAVERHVKAAPPLTLKESPPLFWRCARLWGTAGV